MIIAAKTLGSTIRRGEIQSPEGFWLMAMTADIPNNSEQDLERFAGKL